MTKKEFIKELNNLSEYAPLSSNHFYFGELEVKVGNKYIRVYRRKNAGSIETFLRYKLPLNSYMEKVISILK